MTTMYETDAKDFLNVAETMSRLVKAETLASAQVLALMSIAESLLTLTKHLTKESTQKEEGTP